MYDSLLLWMRCSAARELWQGMHAVVNALPMTAVVKLYSMLLQR